MFNNGRQEPSVRNIHRAAFSLVALKKIVKNQVFTRKKKKYILEPARLDAPKIEWIVSTYAAEFSSAAKGFQAKTLPKIKLLMMFINVWSVHFEWNVLIVFESRFQSATMTDIWETFITFTSRNLGEFWKF